MGKMTFKITDIIAERSLDGKTTYKAIADDGTTVSAAAPNRSPMNQETLRALFVLAYEDQHKENASLLKIGDVI